MMILHVQQYKAHDKKSAVHRRTTNMLPQSLRGCGEQGLGYYGKKSKSIIKSHPKQNKNALGGAVVI